LFEAWLSLPKGPFWLGTGSSRPRIFDLAI
jgi:hypothetical protein